MLQNGYHNKFNLRSLLGDPRKQPGFQTLLYWVITKPQGPNLAERAMSRDQGEQQNGLDERGSLCQLTTQATLTSYKRLWTDWNWVSKEFGDTTDLCVF